MKLTELETAALAAIWTSTTSGSSWVRTNSIQFEQGYSKLAGAMSSLQRKGLVDFRGRRFGNGGRAATSEREVTLTPNGIIALALIANPWTVQGERYVCYNGQPIFITKHMGEGFDGSEVSMAAITSEIVKLLNANGVTYPPTLER